MTSVVLLGCGFVADLYMRSFAMFPDVKIAGVFDNDTNRLNTFCAHWTVPKSPSIDTLFLALPPGSLVINLTNPDAHFDTNMAALRAGHHVFCEKPLAMQFDQAQELAELAKSMNLHLGSAPSSVLGEAAQTLKHAISTGVAGTPRLIYAELDDGFISQAPVRDWKSETGAPWPYRDEFRVGCTLEHAGYYLSWLIAMFGSVRTVVAASSELIPEKIGLKNTAPDFSTATLFFENGPVARLTCSIIAPHDHRIRIIGDDGVLDIKQAWDNGAPVRYRRRIRIRRRLLEHPIGRKIRLSGATHPKVGRWGAASMNFALGPMEMLTAIAENVQSRLSGDYALHLTEVTLAIQNAGEHSGAQTMQTTCAPMEAMPWAR